MEFTLRQLVALRSPECKWGNDEQVREAIELRFPGGNPIDLAELVTAWLADRTLDSTTLYHCASLARRAARCRTGNARLAPRKSLETTLAHLQAPPPPPE